MLQSYDLPTYQRPEVIEVLKDLSLMEDLLGGTRRMHSQSHNYIKQWTAEKDDVYNIRRCCETVYEGTKRTLSASIGMLFAKEPQIDWDGKNKKKATPAPPPDQYDASVDPPKPITPPPDAAVLPSDTGAAGVKGQMQEHMENIDGQGTSLPVFAKRFASASIRDGFACLLVDHAPAPTGVVITAANEKALGLRPTWAMYQRSQIWSWRTAVVNNKTALTQVVLQENAELPLGTFAVEQRQQFRVMQMVNGAATWRILRRRADKFAAYTMGDFELIGSGYFRNRTGETLDHIPLYPGYAGDMTAMFVCTLPLLGVAWANLSHWQQSTDLRFYRMLAAFPQPVVVGVLAEETRADGTSIPGTLKVGPMVAVHLSEGGEFEWKELTGSSMVQLVNGIEDKTQQMSQLGMSFLTKQTRAQETAEAKRLDATAENATLATAGQGVEDAINNAMACHAWYLGIDKDHAPTLTINKDFESTTMDPQTMAVYIQAVVQAGLPARVLLEAWLAGGRLPPETDLDELEAEMMAHAAAIEAEKQAQLDAMNSNPDGTKKNAPGPVDIQYDSATGKKPVRLVPSKGK